ncbi:phosphate-starvation-inducible PsiE family protein [Flavobacterium sp.]|uniref:phosphate-starvation-inducible PsiE family protein n=1 Tax=Flavobacterium sp. TaxID=239 RepID=UPI0024879C50|nr:phosphate-starvation-inducible PsiE family protein [Flavobacterium sp.]MDI1315839.1 phosphate-starvation-inducible PsiE family protein [Flavobacterium sp.]
MNFIDRIIHSTEKTIFYVLSILILLFVIYEVFALIHLFYTEVSDASISDNKSIALSGVSLFFNIIIALEIMETFKGHNDNILRKVKIILLIALTAISRKVIVMDVKHADINIDLGISILILSICFGYFILSYKTRTNSYKKSE